MMTCFQSTRNGISAVDEHGVSIRVPRPVAIHDYLTGPLVVLLAIVFVSSQNLARVGLRFFFVEFMRWRGGEAPWLLLLVAGLLSHGNLRIIDAWRSKRTTCEKR